MRNKNRPLPEVAAILDVVDKKNPDVETSGLFTTFKSKNHILY